MTAMLFLHLTSRSTLRVLAVVAVAVLLPAALHAQSPITGKWQGTTRNGMDVVLDLKVSDSAMTGTVTRNGQTSSITQGKVSGSAFTFNTVLGEQQEALTGELDGKQLKVWLDRQGREGTVLFTRSKD
mgnify:CR=1 FL=1